MAPSNPSYMDSDVLKKIEERLLDRDKIAATIVQDVGVEAAKYGIKGFKGAVDLGKAILETGRQQAEEYEKEIVSVYGDISTQQEKFGKSAAKLSYERTLDLRENFLQMEEGGVKMVDVYEDAAAAAEHANAIIGNLQGSAAQFTEDLQKQNLTIIQYLSKAAGLSEEQSAAFIKLAKGRKEDVKQMLADVGTFSKTLADKFGLDTKRVAKNVAEITTNTSTFGKVSIEAAAAAAAKFESLGVSIEDVSDSIVSSFGSFSGAADAAAKMSQVFGVNIDAMQMMVDVNSGPEGVLRSIDSLRESLIGAGVDASELSAPMRRLIKEMTGVRDDATIESLFDPDRISADTEDILESARKAAEAQKAPADAIEFLSQDIGKIQRGLGDVGELVKTHLLSRLGAEAVEASKGMSVLSTSSAQFFDASNQLIQKATPLGTGYKKGVKAGVVASEVGSVAMEGTRQLVYNEAAARGVDLTRTAGPGYGRMQREGKGVWQDKAYQDITGYVPPQEAVNNGAVTRSLASLQKLKLQAMKEADAPGGVTPDTQAKLDAAKKTAVDAYTAIGVDIQSLIGSAYSSSTNQAGATPDLADVASGTTQNTGAAAPASAASPAAPAMAPATASPVSPVAAPPSVSPASPAAAAPALPTSAAPTAGSATYTASSAVTAVSPGTSTPIGTASATASTSGPPVIINLDVKVGADELTRVLVSRGQLATVGRR